MPFPCSVNGPLWLESLPYPITIRQPTAPSASTPALLLVVLRDLGGLALDVLQHRLNLWPSQKACPQRLIPDPLRQSRPPRRRRPPARRPAGDHAARPRRRRRSTEAHAKKQQKDRIVEKSS